MKYNKMTRRMFLQGTGVTLAIPFLPSVVHGQVGPATETNFLMMNANQGIPRSKFWPLNKTVPYTQADPNTKMRLLKDVITADGKISELLGADWNMHAAKMNIMTHLNLYGSTWDHRPLGPACASTNYSIPNYSIDHCINEAFLKRGFVPKLPFLSVNIGRNFTTGDYFAFAWGVNGGKSYPVTDNIQKLELTVFGSQGSSGSGSGQTSQQKLVDAVLSDYRKLVNDRRISALDKERLENAMDQWNDIQNNSNSGGTCTMPSSVGSTTNLGLQNRQAIDIITAAMSCGLIRVASQALVCAADHDVGRVPMHDMAHGAGDYMSAYRWKLEVIKHAADRLASLKDANGESMINSTVMFYSTEYSDFGNHSLLGRTVMTVGTNRGGLKTGYHINGGGAPVQRAHISVMKAMGLSQAEIELGGKPGFGEHIVYTENYTENNPDGRAYVSDGGKFASDAERRKNFPI